MFEINEPDLSQLPYLYEAYFAASYKSGQKDKAISLLTELLTKADENYIAKEVISNICFFLGMRDEGLYWLNKAYEERSSNIDHLKPFVPKKYLQDPDYLKIMNKIKGRVEWSY